MTKVDPELARRLAKQNRDICEKLLADFQPIIKNINPIASILRQQQEMTRSLVGPIIEAQKNLVAPVNTLRFHLPQIMAAQQSTALLNRHLASQIGPIVENLNLYLANTLRVQVPVLDMQDYLKNISININRGVIPNEGVELSAGFFADDSLYSQPRSATLEKATKILELDRSAQVFLFVLSMLVVLSIVLPPKLADMVASGLISWLVILPLDATYTRARGSRNEIDKI